MKLISIVSAILLLLLVVGCAHVPNKPWCVTDAPEHAHCAFMVQGDDFEVDNSGQHQFKEDGRNWSYDQLKKYSLIAPPDSYGAIKKFFLNWCHQNPNACNYNQAVQRLSELEGSMNYEVTE